MKPCVICDNTGWVCEGHGNHPWNGVSNRPDSCGHGPGKPCPGRDCEYSMYNSERETEIKRLRAELDHFASGGNMITPSPSRETDWGPDVGKEVIPPAPSPWRPIETAPKDGTEVLMVFVSEDGEVLHRVVRWDGSEMWPWRDEYTGYRERDAKGWMPLPTPPQQEPRI